MVSRELARRLWGGEAEAIGRLLRETDRVKPGAAPETYEVVGVAEDARTATVLEPPGPLAYFAYPQKARSRMTLVVRAAGPPAALAGPLRRALAPVHPDLAVAELVPGVEQARRALSEQRMNAEIAGVFALLGLAVAVVGLFGLLSYSVSLRVRELAIRMAVGARPPDVLGLVLGQGLRLAAAGAGLGAAAALALTRLLAGMLFGVGATDPLTFLAVPALLAAVALLACWLPARRAARLDPALALKQG